MIFPPQDVWNVDALPEAARVALRQETASEQSMFALLLDSESVASRGYALEIYSLLQAETRWGTVFPLTIFRDHVHAQAVRLLDDPALAAGESGALVAEANHASALRVMWTVAKQDDIAVLLRGVRVAATPLTQTRAGRAVLFWLQRWPDLPPEIGASMRALVENANIASSVRCIAMRCLLSYRSPDSEAVLLEASMDPDLQVATHAAWVLTRLDLEKHRAHLEALVDVWGDDPPYLGEEVREALGGVSEIPDQG